MKFLLFLTNQFYFFYDFFNKKYFVDFWNKNQLPETTIQYTYNFMNNML